LILDVERGIPDLIGDGVVWAFVTCLLTVLGVKLTCFALLERSSSTGVVGRDGRAFSRFGLLGLLVKEGMAIGFLLELGYLKIDLTRSNFPGLRRKPLDSDLGRLLVLVAVADFERPRGVFTKFGFDGDRESMGI
jgi:hypothetical protein